MSWGSKLRKYKIACLKVSSRFAFKPQKLIENAADEIPSELAGHRIFPFWTFNNREGYLRYLIICNRVSEVACQNWGALKMFCWEGVVRTEKRMYGCHKRPCVTCQTHQRAIASGSWQSRQVRNSSRRRKNTSSASLSWTATRKNSEASNGSKGEGTEEEGTN